MIGKEILNYVITAEIGSGGMGTVYLAENKHIKQQKVAIKMINSGVFGDFAKQRLKEEAERLASLDHPNIVKFLNYDIDDQGNIYLIMEYAEGLTLDKYIHTKTGLIVEDRILPIFEPILDAFEYAHKKKVVHRDIKPSNIIISSEGVPKVLDFGISTIVKEGRPEQESIIMGTPSYMSPEQVKGKGIDTRSDIYSLGVLLHQLLTGNAPYDTTTLSEQDINQKVVNEPLPRLKSYYHYVSDKMQVIVDKATAKDPKDRYQTCADFKRAMRKALVKEPISKALIGTVAALVVLILVGGGIYWDYSRVKVRYYKDYVEQWGVPKGIGKLSSSARKHLSRMYRLEYQHYKLQRLSHVNSFGHIIDDGESERVERPLDMRLYYTDKGKISTAKVYDRGGKVLYVKAYNDKLNSVIFQYDDEYGTEKSLSANTVGYSSAMDEGGDSKGKITRYLIEYDQEGYVSTLQYAGFQNVRVSDANNIYGRSYVRDDKGRVLEEHYLAYDGSPKGTKWGLGIKKFYYDQHDNWVKAEYLTVDGEPALDDSDGLCVYTMDYDQYGNVVQAYHRNADGTLMMPKKNGYASVRETYDNHGLQVKAELLDTEGKPCFSEDGYSKLVFSYDENGYVRRADYYDTEGKLCLSNDGNASFVRTNDEHGNILEYWDLDMKGELAVTSGGIAGGKMKYDEVGNLTEYVAYGIDRKPCLMSDGTAGRRMIYNERGLLSKVVYLDADLKPAAGHDHIGILKIEYDRRGNITRKSFYSANDSTLVLSNEKIAGWTSTYDDNGNETERTFFNTLEKPCSSNEGYAKKTWTYDDQGYVIKERTYNTGGNLVLVDGKAGTDYKYDERGNVIENTPVGLDEKLARGKLTMRYQYDGRDNEIEHSVYERGDKPTVNALNYHNRVSTYNGRNQVVEQRYYGTNGKLTTYEDDKFAIVTYQYDSRGNTICVSTFGTNEKPVCRNEGYATHKSEYDAMGRVVRQTYFDVDGKPTDPKKMVPEGLAGYDKWGNMCYIASADGNGKLINNPNLGCCIIRTEYDSRGHVLATSYYDENDKPVKSTKQGYHKKQTTYTDTGKEETNSFFGVNDEPVNCPDSYHKEVYKYNEQDQQCEVTYWGTKGQAVNAYGYFHKIQVDYNQSGIATTRRYYNASGQVILTQNWDGSDWVVVTNWQDDVRELNASCPIDLGDDFGNIKIVSAKVTGAKSCTLTFQIPLSKYEISPDKLELCKDLTGMLAEYVKDEDIPSYVTVKAVLNDSKGRELCVVYK